MQRETYRMAKENNQMLHAMRRSSFLWGVIKFLVYAILFAAPIWFYLTYVSGTLDELLSEMNKLQGTASQSQAKFSGFENTIQSIESKLPAFLRPQAATSSSAHQ